LVVGCVVWGRGVGRGESRGVRGALGGAQHRTSARRLNAGRGHRSPSSLRSALPSAGRSANRPVDGTTAPESAANRPADGKAPVASDTGIDN